MSFCSAPFILPLPETKLDATSFSGYFYQQCSLAQHQNSVPFILQPELFKKALESDLIYSDYGLHNPQDLASDSGISCSDNLFKDDDIEVKFSKQDTNSSHDDIFSSMPFLFFEDDDDPHLLEKNIELEVEREFYELEQRLLFNKEASVQEPCIENNLHDSNSEILSNNDDSFEEVLESGIVQNIQDNQSSVSSTGMLDENHKKVTLHFIHASSSYKETQLSQSTETQILSQSANSISKSAPGLEGANCEFTRRRNTDSIIPELSFSRTGNNCKNKRKKSRFLKLYLKI